MFKLRNIKVGGKYMTITAILPAYNEEISIGSVVLHARQHVDNVVVVDDGSKDRTAEVAELAGAEVIRHPRNMGKGAALKTGFNYAGRNGTTVIVTMDSDGQHDPEDIPKLMAPIIKGEADIVNGSRYIYGNGKNTPLYRRIGQNVLDNFTNFNCGLHITDTQSGFRAFARHTLPVFRFESRGLEIESEMLVDAAKAGLTIKEVEVGVRYDVDCSSENSLSHGLKVMSRMLHDMELNRPLYYFTVPGMVLTISGIIMGLNLLGDFYHGGNLKFGTTLLMILLTLFGCFMAFTGIILHTMAKVISDKNSRNSFSKKNTIESTSEVINNSEVYQRQIRQYVSHFKETGLRMFDPKKVPGTHLTEDQKRLIKQAYSELGDMKSEDSNNPLRPS
jgi:glycosyltransferase involved in cell wall biosynthesis